MHRNLPFCRILSRAGAACAAGRASVRAGGARGADRAAPHAAERGAGGRPRGRLCAGVPTSGIVPGGRTHCSTMHPGVLLRQHQAVPCHCNCAGSRGAGARLRQPLLRCKQASHADTVTALYCQERSNADALVHMLEQEFAGASRAASCGDAPRCMYTHPGVRHMLRFVLVCYLHRMLRSPLLIMYA